MQAWPKPREELELVGLEGSGNLIRAVVRAEGITTIDTTHDRALMDIADRVLTIQNGQVFGRPPDPGPAMGDRRQASPAVS